MENLAPPILNSITQNTCHKYDIGLCRAETGEKGTVHIDNPMHTNDRLLTRKETRSSTHTKLLDGDFMTPYTTTLLLDP